jgi:hypothetical protein
LGIRKTRFIWQKLMDILCITRHITGEGTLKALHLQK